MGFCVFYTRIVFKTYFVTIALMAKEKLYVIAGVGLAVLIAAGFGYYIYKDQIFAPKPNPNGTGTSTVSIGGVEFEGDPEAKVELVTIPLPDLNRPVSANNLPEPARSDTLTKIKNLQTKLKADSKDYNAWIDLGIYLKETEDYEGARLSWEYAAALVPSQSLAFINLGTLHTYYIHDNAKAEEYYLEAVKVEPKLGYTYHQLYELYRLVMKDDAKAKAILRVGIAAGATDSDRMQYFLDNYNKL